MTDKTPPCVIDFDDIREGDLLELTNPDIADWATRARVMTIDKGGDIYLHGHGYLFKGSAIKVVLLDRPKPALPTEPGTVIRCTLNTRPGAVLVRGLNFWHGVGDGGWSVRDVGSDRITDWTVVYDPNTPDPKPVTVLEVTEDDFGAITCDKPCPGRGYTCTRPEGHDGLHIAAITGHGVYAYWTEVQP